MLILESLSGRLGMDIDALVGLCSGHCGGEELLVYRKQWWCSLWRDCRGESAEGTIESGAVRYREQQGSRWGISTHGIL